MDKIIDAVNKMKYALDVSSEHKIDVALYNRMYGSDKHKKQFDPTYGSSTYNILDSSNFGIFLCSSLNETVRCAILMHNKDVLMYMLNPVFENHTWHSIGTEVNQYNKLLSDYMEITYRKDNNQLYIHDKTPSGREKIEMPELLSIDEHFQLSTIYSLPGGYDDYVNMVNIYNNTYKLLNGCKYMLVVSRLLRENDLDFFRFNQTFISTVASRIANTNAIKETL